MSEKTPETSISNIVSDAISPDTSTPFAHRVLTVIENKEITNPEEQKISSLEKTIGELYDIIKSQDERLQALTEISQQKDDTIQELRKVIEVKDRELDQRVAENANQNKIIEKRGTDSLTKLSNRHCFEDLKERLDAAKDNGRYGFIFVDLNELKPINDTMGHESGDALLIAMADALREKFPTDHVFRWGGDEFVVVCKTTSDNCVGVNLKNVLEVKAQNLKKEHKIVIIEKDGENVTVPLSFSAGASVFMTELGDKTFEDAIRRADERMYNQKQGDRRSNTENDTAPWPSSYDRRQA